MKSPTKIILTIATALVVLTILLLSTVFFYYYTHAGQFKPKFPQQKNCILLTLKVIVTKWISLYWEQSQQFKGPFL